MAKDGLTHRQEAFVREYLVDMNGTDAARRAGYRGSRETLAVTASDLLRNPKVAQRVNEAKARRAERTELEADRVLAEVARLALMDPGEAFAADGTLMALKDMPPAARRAISSVEVKTVEDGAVLTRVRFWDKPKALELAMRHLGLLRDRVELTGEGGKPLSITIDLGAGK